MDKEKIVEAMGCIAPDLIGSADVDVKPRRRWTRPALIAACLCLVLAGTALAAELAGVHVSDFFTGMTDWEGRDHSYLGYEVQADGLRCLPADSLDPGVEEYIRETRGSGGFYMISMPLYSMKRAEEFLGVDLPDNPFLERASLGVMGFDVGDLVTPTGDGPLTEYSRHVGAPGYILLSGWEDTPGAIEIKIGYKFHYSERTEETETGWSIYPVYMPVYVSMQLFTGEEETAFSSERRMVENEYGGYTAIDKTSYTAPSGLEATIMTYQSAVDSGSGEELEPAYCYAAYFVLDGILFEVEGGFDDGALAYATMIEILDGFVYEPAPEN